MMIHTFHTEAEAQTIVAGRAPYLAFDEVWFEQVFTALDRLHDAASAGCSTSSLPVTPELMVGWLEDIIYTAQETIREIRANVPVHILRDPSRQGESEEKHGTA